MNDQNPTINKTGVDVPADVIQSLVVFFFRRGECYLDCPMLSI